MLSLCVLYSMMVLGGRFRTLLRVSRMRDVVVWSLDVRFQMDKMSSCKTHTHTHTPVELESINLHTSIGLDAIETMHTHLLGCS